MRLAVALLVATCTLAASSHAGGEPPFQGSISTIGAKLGDRMTPTSWRPGCPVHIRDLRLLTVTHWGFDGDVRTGKLVVHEDVAREVQRAMRRLYEVGFPIRRMRLIDAYGGSDFRSIEADNTSAFNCRTVAGTSRWSEHAYGQAIDINPIENPYVSSGRTSHEKSERYLDRTRKRRGMIRAGDAVVRAFVSIDWGWGGYWPGSVKDYQHFSASGR
jgi:D-alanyl-D-alanine carboxypeptidase